MRSASLNGISSSNACAIGILPMFPALSIMVEVLLDSMLSRIASWFTG